MSAFQSFSSPLSTIAGRSLPKKRHVNDGRRFRLLVLIDDYTRECLAIRVARKLGNQEVVETLTDVMLEKGSPEHLRSDNGPEFVARELRKWLAGLGTETLFIEREVPGQMATAKASTTACGTSV